ncbi:MAG: hypothetical protein QOE77_1545 [Blastocatellia bacterium]|jgi:photosystem II stability/assembly factor-like uncharacterized protein|nr:hypothetical protein [Blastocatellia bacterium]
MDLSKILHAGLPLHQSSRNHGRPIAGRVVLVSVLAIVVAGLAVDVTRRRRATEPLPSAAAGFELPSRIAERADLQWAWQRRDVSSEVSLKKIQMLSKETGWSASYEGKLYRTSDAGQSWQSVSLNVPQRAYMTDIFFVNPESGWVALAKTDLDFDAASGKGVDDTATWIMRTSNGGRDWSQQLSREGAQVSHISFVDGQRGWAVGRTFGAAAPTNDSNLVLHTTDGGNSWTDLSKNVPDSGSGVAQLYGVNGPSASLLTDSGAFYRTVDDGETWRALEQFRDEPEQTSIRRVALTQNNRLRLLGGAWSNEGTWSIFANQASDGAWIRYRLPGVYLSDALFLSDDSVIAGGFIDNSERVPSVGGREGLILYSSDLGKNWVVVYRDRNLPPVNALSTTDSKHIWAVGEAGLTLRLERPALTASKTSSK